MHLALFLVGLGLAVLAVYNGATGGLNLAKYGDTSIVSFDGFDISVYDVILYVIGFALIALALLGE